MTNDSIGSSDESQNSSKDFAKEASKSGTDARQSAGLERSVPTAAADAADEATPTVPSAAALFSERRGSSPPPLPLQGGRDATAESVRSQHDHGTTPDERASSRQGGLEQLIGGRVMALVGGVIVVIAAAFFAKLAYDKGWIGNIPAGARAAALTAFGAAILGVGEFLFRRYGRAAAVGLFIAGLGTLYVDAWSAGPVLGLLSPLHALIAMAMVTVIGILLTARSGSVSIGVVSIAAGAAAPYLAGGDGGPAVLGMYLTSLLVIAFAAASIRPRPFLKLRMPAFVILLIAAVPWLLLAVGDGATTILLIIASAWWLIVHLQALHMASRGLASGWNEGLGFVSTAVFAIFVPLGIRASVAFGGGTFGDWTSPEGWIPLGLAAFALVTIFQMGTGLEALAAPSADRVPRRRRDRCLNQWSLVLWIEAGVLLLVSAGLLLEGPAVAVAWSGLGLASIYLAHRMQNRGIAIFSLVVASLGQLAAMVIVLGEWRATGMTVWFDRTPWSWSASPSQWLPFVVLLVLFAIARLWPNPTLPRTSRSRTTVIGPSLTMFIAAPLFVGTMAPFGGEASFVLMLSIAVFAATLVARSRGDHAGWTAGLILNGLGSLIALLLLFQAVVLVQGGDLNAADVNQGIGLSTIFFWTMVPYAFLVLQMLWLSAGSFGSVSPNRQRIVGNLNTLQFVLPAIVGSMVWFVNSATPWAMPVANFFAGAAAAALMSTLLIVLSGRTFWKIGRSLAGWIVVSASWIWLGVTILESFGVFANQADEVAFGMNLRFGSGLALLMATLLTAKCWPRAARVDVESPERSDQIVPISGLLSVLVGLWIGSFALLDLFGRDGVEFNAALSIFWAAYAIALIGGGFFFGIAIIRHLGLLLLGVTAMKFLFFDLSRAATVYRVISALGLGLLMVATSLIYVRFGSRLDRKIEESAD